MPSERAYPRFRRDLVVRRVVEAGGSTSCANDVADWVIWAHQWWAMSITRRCPKNRLADGSKNARIGSRARTPIPMVVVESASLKGLDSLLSIVQMPAGVPVATVSVGGARNAGLLAVRILAAVDPELRARMAAFQAALATSVLEKDAALRDREAPDAR